MEAIMAQSKKRVTLRKRKSTVRGRVRKSSKSVRSKAAKGTATKLRSKKAVAKPKRPKAEKVARKKAKPPKPPITPVAETTIVDVGEKPAPDVITITEFEETEIREAGAGEEPPD
jgi:hypothetical protein